MNLGEDSTRGLAQQGRNRSLERGARFTRRDDYYQPEEDFFMSGALPDDEMPPGSPLYNRNTEQYSGIPIREAPPRSHSNVPSAIDNIQNDNDDELADYYTRLGRINTHGR